MGKAIAYITAATLMTLTGLGALVIIVVVLYWLINRLRRYI